MNSQDHEKTIGYVVAMLDSFVFHACIPDTYMAYV